jgi:divalent metal cation (Fe/Co/Zn/Cd) transporter
MKKSVGTVVVNPSRRKLRVANALGSRALRADAHETIVCAWLSFTTLLGLVLNAALGWWWADPAAGCLLVFYAAREVRAIIAAQHTGQR